MGRMRPTLLLLCLLPLAAPVAGQAQPRQVQPRQVPPWDMPRAAPMQPGQPRGDSLLNPAVNPSDVPADLPPLQDLCRPPPPGSPSLPIYLDLQGRPGVPKGVTGQVGIDVPLAAPDCSQPVHLPRDPLHGDPGDVLRGPQPGDVLHGDGAVDPLTGAPRQPPAQVLRGRPRVIYGPAN